MFVRLLNISSVESQISTQPAPVPLYTTRYGTDHRNAQQKPRLSSATIVESGAGRASATPQFDDFVLLVDTELIYVLNFSRMTFSLLIGQREGSATGING